MKFFLSLKFLSSEVFERVWNMRRRLLKKFFELLKEKFEVEGFKKIYPNVIKILLFEVKKNNIHNI